MGIIEDEKAQTAAEFVLIFGGILVIVIIALIVYQRYIEDMGSEINDSAELENISKKLEEINDVLK